MKRGIAVCLVLAVVVMSFTACHRLLPFPSFGPDKDSDAVATTANNDWIEFPDDEQEIITRPTTTTTTQQEGEWPSYPTYSNPDVTYPSTSRPTVPTPGKTTSTKPVTTTTTTTRAPVVSNNTISIPALPQKTHTIATLPQSSTSFANATYKTYSGSITANGQSKTHSYTAVRTGVYYLQLSNVYSGVEFNLFVKDSLGKTVMSTYGAGNGEGISFDLTQGSSYTFEIKQYSNSGNYTLTLNEPTATQTVSPYSSFSHSITFHDQRNFYTLKADRDGMYYLWLSNLKSGVEFNLFIRNELGETVNSTYSAGNGEGFKATLDGGKTYTIEVRYYSGYAPYTLNIGKQKATVDVSAYSAVKDHMEFHDQRNFYTLKADRDGMYYLWLNNLKSGVEFNLFIRNELGETVNSTYSAGNGEGFKASLEGGKTYTIEVCYYSGYASYTLNIGKQKVTLDVSAYTVVKDSIEFREQRNLYRFVPKKSGTYTLSMSNLPSSASVAVYVFNELGERVNYDSSMKNGESFSAKNLTAGATYTIEVRWYSGMGAYQLTIAS